MTRLLLPALFLLAGLGVHTPAAAQEAPAWRTFAEATGAAPASGKKVLLDVYAPWCGWCRKMQAEVYTDAALRAYLHDHFEIARVDLSVHDDTLHYRGFAVSSAELAAGLGATATPTTVFLEPDGTYITRLPGFHPTADFLQVLRFIATDAYRTQTFEAFRQGEDAGG